MSDTPPLSRREREILDIVYRLGRVTAAEVREQLSGSPSDSSVRTILRLMEEKGHLTHEVDGPRYVYVATTPPEVASRRAVRHLVQTFFGGDPRRLVSALLDDEQLDESELEELARLVDTHRS
ncbi:MAG: BlaI/MecI/CopY family transcriptional regulator [Alphaproteobacteria bacterium]|nr:BlaI/MecI/CopY family transcriptional regulator [Alphaproteobacteria bacterium]MCB9699478.1 BlaI/MecI/CopY family transcriptional regulator [Alphaproteobacteria bacterium]